MRLFGTVHLAGEDNAFELCDIGQISDADAIFDELDMCVAIAVDAGTTTSFFDADAAPISFGDLVEGNKASVYGYYQNTNGEALAAEIVAVGDRGTFHHARGRC